MNLFLPLGHSGNVKPLPATRWSMKHSRENEVCFRSVPGNLQVLQSFLHREKGIQSEIAGDSIGGSSQDSSSNLLRRRSYELSRIHVGHSSECIQSGSSVES